MSLVVASQLGPEFDAELAALPFDPKIVSVNGDEPWRVADEADVLVVRPSPQWQAMRGKPVPSGWPGRLRWVFSASTGIDTYPAWLLDAPLVTCGRGTASDEIADYVMAAIYQRSKNLDAVTVRSAAEWRVQSLGGVMGSTVGILGMGAIGQAVASRALALGMRVVGVRRRDTGAAIPGGVELLTGFAEVVKRADHIVIALPSTPQTFRAVDVALLARAKPNAHLINVARGAIVDQKALVDALDAQRLGFATLDVTDPEPLPEGDPLYTHAKVRLTPHISAHSEAVRHRLLEKLKRDLCLFAKGEQPGDVVDPVSKY